jgi:hypothetical protein
MVLTELFRMLQLPHTPTPKNTQKSLRRLGKEEPDFLDDDLDEAAEGIVDTIPDIGIQDIFCGA